MSYTAKHARITIMNMTFPKTLISGLTKSSNAKTMTRQVGNELNYPELPILQVVEPTIAKKLADGENLREIYNTVFNIYKQQVLKKAGMA